MHKEDNFRRPLLKFFLLAYLIFWVLFAITGVVIMLKAPKIIQYILPIICSWAPSFAFLILFKKLHPDLKLKEFLKQQFCSAIRISLLAAILIIYIVIFILTITSYSAINNIPIFSTLVTSSNIIIFGFLNQLVRGPLGEELGWRGYALNELQKKYSPLLSAIIIGVVWGFWHTPLWFLTSGYSGANLMKYIVLFMIFVISTSVIITTFYNLNNNLVIPILIHQLVNYSMSLIKLDVLQVLFYITPLYLILAAILIAINPNKALYRKRYKADTLSDTSVL
jgi:membrane protease YdiL (CAAX protease family)